MSEKQEGESASAGTESDRYQTRHATFSTITLKGAMSSMTTVKKLSIVVSTCAVIGGLLLSAQASYAGPISINNPRFEANSLGEGNHTINSITGWTAVNNGGNGGVFNPGDNEYPGASNPADIFTTVHGQNVAYSNGRTIQQQLNATFDPAAVYRLSVDVGRRLDVPFPSTGAYIQLLAGTQVIASVATPVPSSGGFLTVTATYNPRRDNRNNQYDQYAGQPLTIRLGSNDGNTFTGQVNWDNVKLRKQ